MLEHKTEYYIIWGLFYDWNTLQYVLEGMIINELSRNFGASEDVV